MSLLVSPASVCVKPISTHMPCAQVKAMSAAGKVARVAKNTAVQPGTRILIPKSAAAFPVSLQPAAQSPGKCSSLCLSKWIWASSCQIINKDKKQNIRITNLLWLIENILSSLLLNMNQQRILQFIIIASHTTYAASSSTIPWSASNLCKGRS